jgi:hypothetical protein
MVKDFSIKENPDGVWAYWDNDPNRPMPYARRNYKGLPGFECWYDKTTRFFIAAIGVNRSGQTIALDRGDVAVPPGYIFIDSADASAFVQFTVPVSGKYTIKGRYIPLAQREAHDNFGYVGQFGSKNRSLWERKIDGHGPKRFNLTVSLEQGDTLQFLQRQKSGKQSNDVGLAVKITGP